MGYAKHAIDRGLDGSLAAGLDLEAEAFVDGVRDGGRRHRRAVVPRARPRQGHASPVAERYARRRPAASAVRRRSADSVGVGRVHEDAGAELEAGDERTRAGRPRPTSGTGAAPGAGPLCTTTLYGGSPRSAPSAREHARSDGSTAPSMLVGRASSKCGPASGRRRAPRTATATPDGHQRREPVVRRVDDDQVARRSRRRDRRARGRVAPRRTGPPATRDGGRHEVEREELGVRVRDRRARGRARGSRAPARGHARRRRAARARSRSTREHLDAPARRRARRSDGRGRATGRSPRARRWRRGRRPGRRRSGRGSGTTRTRQPGLSGRAVTGAVRPRAASRARGPGRTGTPRRLPVGAARRRPARRCAGARPRPGARSTSRPVERVVTQLRHRAARVRRARSLVRVPTHPTGDHRRRSRGQHVRDGRGDPRRRGHARRARRRRRRRAPVGLHPVEGDDRHRRRARRS